MVICINCHDFQQEFSDETIHLLFSANRWESANKIIQTLNAGVSLIVDRYCFSGVAFTAAKGMWGRHRILHVSKPIIVYLDSVVQ